MQKMETISLSDLLDDIKESNKIRNKQNKKEQNKKINTKSIVKSKSKIEKKTTNLNINIKKVKKENQKHIIIGKTSCGACKQQKNLIEKKYIAYSINRGTVLDRLKGTKINLPFKWVTAEESIKNNKEILEELQSLYDKKKISDEEYETYKKAVIDSVIIAENMLTDRYDKIAKSFEFRYIDDPNKELAEKTKKEFKSVGGIAYPLFLKNNCSAKRDKTGIYTRTHCKEYLNSGVNGLVDFYLREEGKTGDEIVSDQREILQLIQNKYKKTDSNIDIMINDEIGKIISLYEEKKRREKKKNKDKK